jgi:hypothetical protein
MEIKYSREIPITTERNGVRRTLNYNVRELSESEINELWEKEIQKDDMSYEAFAKEHKYAYYTLTMGNARWDYNGIVEAIIREKYSIDQMEAITNNMNASVGSFFNVLVSDGIVGAIKYLKDSADEDNTVAFREMQEWRAKAKVWAREVFKK